MFCFLAGNFWKESLDTAMEARLAFGCFVGPVLVLKYI